MYDSDETRFGTSQGGSVGESVKDTVKVGHPVAGAGQATLGPETFTSHVGLW